MTDRISEVVDRPSKVTDCSGEKYNSMQKIEPFIPAIELKKLLEKLI